MHLLAVLRTRSKTHFPHNKEINMARPKLNRLNDKPSEVIEKAFLEESPEELPVNEKVVIAKQIPVMDEVEFRNDRDPGIPLEFHYATKTHPLKKYKLIHGHRHTLPREVVDHLDSCKIPMYSYRKGSDGHPEMFVTGYKHSFTCRPVRQNAMAA